jgi:hypothetical protein
LGLGMFVAFEDNVTEILTKEFADYKPGLVAIEELSCENDNS